MALLGLEGALKHYYYYYYICQKHQVDKEKQVNRPTRDSTSFWRNSNTVNTQGRIPSHTQEGVARGDLKEPGLGGCL
jgi:hypothetical protein